MYLIITDRIDDRTMYMALLWWRASVWIRLRFPCSSACGVDSRRCTSIVVPVLIPRVESQDDYPGSNLPRPAWRD
jgi:hypothetical protein